MFQYQVLDIEENLVEAKQVVKEYKMGTIDPGRNASKYEQKMSIKRKIKIHRTKKLGNGKKFGLECIAG